MPRRYRRRTYIRRPLKTVKYSNETSSFVNSPTGAATDSMFRFQPLILIPPVDVQGTRKVKNVTLRMAANSSSTSTFIWALVYVPDGMSPQSIETSTTNEFESLYEPNQNVIMSGLLTPTLWKQGQNIADCSITPSTYRSRLARNLNSGDAICLLIASPNGFPGWDQTTDPNNPPITFYILANFAISY